MIYSSFHMTQEVAIAILQRIRRMSVPRHFFISTTDSTDWTDECPMAIKEIKKFIPFPRLTPLQPDAYGHPRKRASLSAPPHPSGLPRWQTESIKSK